MMSKPGKNSERRNLFNDKDVEKLTEVLNRIDQVTEIGWKFDDEGLAISGLKPEGEVFIGHPRAARAFLDAYLLGYDHGFKDGREGP